MISMIRCTAIAIFMIAAGSANAGYRGPHPVCAYGGNEYAVVSIDRGSTTDLTFYRAVGSRWQRIGVTTLRKGQRSSNGSWRQNIWFNCRKVRTVTGDLRNPFYRLLPSHDAAG